MINTYSMKDSKTSTAIWNLPSTLVSTETCWYTQCSSIFEGIKLSDITIATRRAYIVYARPTSHLRKLCVQHDEEKIAGHFEVGKKSIPHQVRFCDTFVNFWHQTSNKGKEVGCHPRLGPRRPIFQTCIQRKCSLYSLSSYTRRR